MDTTTKRMLVKAKAVRDIRELTTDKEYETIDGIEAGIFYDRPFVSVIGDYGKIVVCHLSRFEIIKELEDLY